MDYLDPREVQPGWKVVAQRELRETPEVMKNCLAELRAIISDDFQLRCPTDDAFLVKFLRGRKYRVHDAADTIRNYFRFRRDNPEFFRELRPDSFNYDLLVRKHRLIMILKNKDSLGRAVGFMRAGE